MYAVIRQYELGAGSPADFIRHIDDEVVDDLTRLQGFVSYQLIQSGEDEIVAVTIFEREQDAGRYSTTAADFVSGVLAPFKLTIRAAMSGEVGVSRPARHSRGPAGGPDA